MTADPLNSLLDALADRVADRVVKHLEARRTAQPQGNAAARYLDERGVESRYGLKRRTLQGWRARGKGPRFRRGGRRILYCVADIDKFLEQPTN
jgi:hypothetical protein